MFLFGDEYKKLTARSCEEHDIELVIDNDEDAESRTPISRLALSSRNAAEGRPDGSNESSLTTSSRRHF